MNAYEQKMIEIGNKNEKFKRDKWNYFHHFLIFPLLGANHRLLLLHMDKSFIRLEETSDRINNFEIEYMINPTLRVNKEFKEQVINCMNNTFGALTQPFIRKKLTKNNTSVLALLMFHETKEKNTKKSFRVLSCVIYAIDNNYVCIYYLYFLKKNTK